MNRSTKHILFDLIKCLIDLLTLALAAQWVAWWHFHQPLWELPPAYAIFLYSSTTLAILTFSRIDLYGSWRGRSMLIMFARLLIAWTMVAVLSLLLTSLIHDTGNLSRVWIAEWFALVSAGLLGYRALIYNALRLLRRRFRISIKRVAIVGYGSIGRQLHERMQLQDWFGYEIKAIYGASADDKPYLAPTIELITTIDAVQTVVAANDIDEVWIALPISESDSIQRVQSLLRKTLVAVRLFPDTSPFSMPSNFANLFMGFMSVDINSPHASDAEMLAKEAMDRLFALVALILLLPLFAAVAVGVKLSSPGPVLFKQARHGLNGKRFYIYKFRTMRVSPATNSIVQATLGDPRITPIGLFLRRTSIDELPQFINVLKGEMSVVGPRPHAVQHNEHYGELLDMYMQRHRVKPGITGWAQMHGCRGETDTLEKMAARVRFDLDYIRDWSLWLDVRIIAWTVVKGWTGENAY